MIRRRGRAEVGRKGERTALRFFRRRGYRLVERNFCCPEGELDLVVRRGTLVVIVEVRTVTQDHLTSPLESVTPAKRRRVRRAARRFLQLYAPPHRRLRFDLVGVRLRRRLWPRVEWRRGDGEI